MFHYPHVWGPKGRGYQPHSSLRWGAHKIIYFYDTREWELYNISNDISEKKDLIQSEQKLARQMAERLIQSLEQHGAQYPLDRKLQTAVRPQLSKLTEMPSRDK